MNSYGSCGRSKKPMGGPSVAQLFSLPARFAANALPKPGFQICSQRFLTDVYEKWRAIRFGVLGLQGFWSFLSCKGFQGCVRNLEV